MNGKIVILSNRKRGSNYRNAAAKWTERREPINEMWFLLNWNLSICIACDARPSSDHKSIHYIGTQSEFLIKFNIARFAVCLLSVRFCFFGSFFLFGLFLLFATRRYCCFVVDDGVDVGVVVDVFQFIIVEHIKFGAICPNAMRQWPPRMRPPDIQAILCDISCHRYRCV